MAGSACVHFTECDTAGIFNPNFVTTDMFDVRSEHSQYDDYYYDLYVFLSRILLGKIFTFFLTGSEKTARPTLALGKTRSAANPDLV